MEPLSLRYFREVAAHGSVRHAAERMFVAQSAVSRQITLLETELGVPLFERHARGMLITEAGQLLLRYSNDMRTRFDELRGILQEYETLRRGHAEIACVEGLMTSFMPEAMHGFSHDNPAISLGVISIGSQAVAEAIAEHRYDLGVLFGSAPRTDLVELARMPQPLYAVVSPSHPLAHSSRCTLADIAPYPVVLPDRSFVIRQLVDRVCVTRKLSLSRMVETNTLAFAQMLVIGSSTHVTFLPADLLTPSIKQGTLVGLSLDELSLKSGHVTLVASRTRKLSLAANHLASYLAERMAAKHKPHAR